MPLLGCVGSAGPRHRLGRGAPLPFVKWRKLVGGGVLRVVVIGEVLGWPVPVLLRWAFISVTLLGVGSRLPLTLGGISGLRLRIRCAVRAGRGRTVGSDRSSMGIGVSLSVGWVLVTTQAGVVERIRKVINVAAAAGRLKVILYIAWFGAVG